MLRILGLIVSILLIGLIFLRIPRENVGLTIFTKADDFLGSITSAQRSLNILIGLVLLSYFIIAFELNNASTMFSELKVLNT